MKSILAVLAILVSPSAAFAKEQKFSDGYFYVISPSSPTPKDSIWAWEAGGRRVILPDLENGLAAKTGGCKAINPTRLHPGKHPGHDEHHL